MTLECPDDQDFVIFGVTGDLARRKLLPALYSLYLRGLLPARGHIIGLTRSPLEDAAFRSLARTAIEAASNTPLDAARWDGFAGRLRCFRTDHEGLTATRECCSHFARTLYLAVPPSAVAGLVKDIGEAGLVPGTRLVVEKPFGSDRASSIKLTEVIQGVFPEDQVFRIDHYLGKETVQNILVFRFGNALFERTWNREAIDHVQITVAESLGMEGRGASYDPVGAIRDIVQNHILQVLALLTMEPPALFRAQAIRDEKAKLLNAVQPIAPDQVVRGQYGAGAIDGEHVAAYRDEPGVGPQSKTETYAAARLFIDNWRWAGVPFLLRTGKRLPRRTTEIHVAFRSAPVRFFQSSGLDEIENDHLTISIQPTQSISLTFQAKVPGPEIAVKPVDMKWDYGDSFMHKPAEAYERLIHDVMRGDQTLFARDDEVDRAWEVLQPVLEAPPPVEMYPAGTWGPASADRLVAPEQWHLH